MSFSWLMPVPPIFLQNHVPTLHANLRHGSTGDRFWTLSEQQKLIFLSQLASDVAMLLICFFTSEGLFTEYLTDNLFENKDEIFKRPD